MTALRPILSYSCLMPPTIFIVTCLIGVLIGIRHARIGRIIVFLSAALLYLFTIPAVPRLIEREFLSTSTPDLDFTRARVIVVPGVDVRRAQEGLPDAVGAMTLERLANAARLYRRLRIPVLVTGSASSNRPGPSLASLMRDELEQNFSVPVSFTETQAQNTFEHGLYASRMLIPEGIYDVVVVAQQRDLKRLLWSFEKAGLRPAPAGIATFVGSLELRDFLPSASAFLESYYDVHEVIGNLYYRLAY